MEEADLMSQCQAMSKTTGEPCQKTAIPGGRVCRYHGGGAPQVIKAARERILESIDDVTADLIKIARNPEVPYNNRIQAINSLLDRGGLIIKREMEVTHIEGDPKVQLASLLDDLEELEKVNSVDELPNGE